MEVKKYILRATELTALSVWKLIKDKGYSSKDLLDEDESLSREKLIDQAGVDAMATALTDIPLTLEVVGSEGRKHIHQYGEALPSLEGIFGHGDKLDMVNDVVEGSKAAKLNTVGAVSVMAVSSHKGLMATPSDIDYMDKLFGPPQLKDKISLKKSLEENLSLTVGTFGVSPSEINVVIMDRDRNLHYINTAKSFGVNLILIKAGDFLPSVLSCLDPKTHKKGIHLVVGIGGFEEGILAATAAKALGGVAEGKGWSGDKDIQKKYNMVWRTEDLVPGEKKDCLACVSSITGDTWFDLSAIKEAAAKYRVTSLIISSQGANIVESVHR